MQLPSQTDALLVKPNEVLFGHIGYLSSFIVSIKDKEVIRIVDSKYAPHNVQKKYVLNALGSYFAKYKRVCFIATHMDKHSLYANLPEYIDYINKHTNIQLVKLYESPNFCNRNYMTGNYLNFFIYEVKHA